MVTKIVDYIKNDIWRIRVKQLSKKKFLLVRSLRVFLLSLREFGKDQCHLRASALTFFSLLSIVPVFAMAFGVAKGFGLEKLLQDKLLANVEGQEQAILKIIHFAQAMLENTKGGVVAGFGIILLFWTVIKVLGNIEKSFNHIWGVKKERTIGRKFGDYISLMLICPVFVILSSSLTVFITSQITLITEKISILGVFGPIIFSGLKLLPYVMLWALFTFLYSFMPNTKVKFSSAMLGGIVGGTVYQIVQKLYIHFQIGVSSSGAIYGSFAALPLFLIWLQISWLIVLFGAEISFAHQNEETFEFEADCSNASQSFKRALSLRITQLCVRNFCDDKEPWTATELASHLETPIRLIRQVLYELSGANVLSEVGGDNGRVVAYQPAHDVEKITIKNVLDALAKRGHSEIPIRDSEEFENIQKHLSGLSSLIEKSPDNFLLKNI